MIEPLVTLAGIVLPSLVIAVAVRRWFDRVDWRTVALLLALAVAFIGRGVFTRDMPLPLDEVMRGYPYHGVFPVTESKNDLTNDTVKQILPWMQTVREQLARGIAPLWNPYLFCGYPLLGNGQSAPFAPLFLATLFVPLPKQLVAMAGAKLFVALLFGYVFIRREGASHAAAVFGSATFAFAIFNNCFLYYPMTAVTLLLPAAAYATLATLHERRRAPVVLLAAVVASLLAGGHPESVVHVAMCCVALVAIDRNCTLRDLGRVVFAAVCGLLISAPAWLPVLEQVRVSLRVNLLRPGEAMGKMFVFPATTLWALVNPDGFGNPAHHNWKWFMQYPHVAAVYLGLIVTALVACAIVGTTRDRLLLLLAALFFVMSMAWTPLGKLFYVVPPLSWVAHDRLRSVVAFLAGVIAARAVTRWSRRDLAVALLVSIPLLGCATYVFVKAFSRTLTWWSLAGVAALVLFWIAAAAAPRRVAVFASVLTIAELFVFTFDYNAMTDRRYYEPRLPIFDALRRAAPPDPFRVLGLDWTLLPNAADQYHLEDVRGSDPMEWGEYANFFGMFELRDRSIDVKRIADPDKPVIDFLNVRYLMTEPGVALSSKWRRLYSGPDGELYENSTVLPRFFVPAVVRRAAGGDWKREVAGVADFRETAIVGGRGAPAMLQNPGRVRLAVMRDGPGRYTLTAHAPERAFVASSQPAMAGWRVRVDGKRVDPLRVNGVFIGFFVPRGTSRVIVDYLPAAWWWGLALAAIGAVALALSGHFTRVGRSSEIVE
jgi:hypothetical protein